jgi:hypothetical protein
VSVLAIGLTGLGSTGGLAGPESVGLGSVSRMCALKMTLSTIAATNRGSGNTEHPLEVDLRLRAGLMDLRNVDLDGHQTQLRPAPGDIPRHRGLRHDRLVLSNQPLAQPPGCMSLPPRDFPVRQQPKVDESQSSRPTKASTVTDPASAAAAAHYSTPDAPSAYAPSVDPPARGSTSPPAGPAGLLRKTPPVIGP